VARDAYPADPKRGERLRRLRLQVEYADQGSVARGAGVSVAGLRKWENGGEIEAKSVAALVRFYGANPRWIMEGTEPVLRPEDSWLERLSQLEEQVSRQRRLLADLLGSPPYEDSEEGDAQRAADAARLADEASNGQTAISPGQPAPTASERRSD
jgi:transcriptional regulator with XRE-family HTH domain